MTKITAEILEKGDELNLKHAEYKDAQSARDRKSKWITYYSACLAYQKEVQNYIQKHPIDLVETL